MQKKNMHMKHALDAPSLFTPDALVAAVRSTRRMAAKPVPSVCVLEFDGELTDLLVARGAVRKFDEWPCFHTELWVWKHSGISCGIISRTIGGAYTVLVAEQLVVCGAQVIVGLASAGRVAKKLPLPSIVIAARAIRDEGTSLHYLPPAFTVDANRKLAPLLEREISAKRLPVCRGLVWTTDAPYRETAPQLAQYAAAGALAVEMQAASLFAFGKRRGVATGLVAHVTNAPDYDGPPFDKRDDTDERLLGAICRAGHRYLAGTKRGAYRVRP